jgi:hypothetical protein
MDLSTLQRLAETLGPLGLTGAVAALVAAFVTRKGVERQARAVRRDEYTIGMHTLVIEIVRGMRALLQLADDLALQVDVTHTTENRASTLEQIANQIVKVEDAAEAFLLRAEGDVVRIAALHLQEHARITRIMCTALAGYSQAQQEEIVLSARRVGEHQNRCARQIDAFKDAVRKHLPLTAQRELRTKRRRVSPLHRVLRNSPERERSD